MSEATFWIVGGLFAFWSIVISAFSYHTGMSDMKQEAVEAGVAFYSVNPTNGVSKFEWRKL